jgi:hypothetical protein
VFAYVAHSGGAKQSIAERMQSHVSVAVAKQPEAVGYLHAANNAFAAFHQSVNVKSVTYAHINVSFCRR